MKLMKKIAMVKGDGTVELDVNSSARYAADLFGRRMRSSSVYVDQLLGLKMTEDAQ